MGYIEAIILGLVQGLSEFLPISSSGHLALLENLFEIKEDSVIFFAVLLHIGTLVSIFIVYHEDIYALIKELFLLFKDIFTGKGLKIEERPIRKLGIMIIVSSIPTAIMGLLFSDYIDRIFGSLTVISICWIITGFILLFSEKLNNNKKEIEGMKYRNAIFVGICQGLAIMPGISRSGSTIVGSLVTGLKREFAVEFAFLISIPAILGSAVLEFPKAIKAGIEPSTIGPMIVGFLVAAISGYFAITTMIRIVSKHRMRYFSYYVWILGVGTFIYSVLF
ncbi:MAG: undecaprenyl-diphosphatase UppP [Clostridiales bacterium]|nr:undecaprenyl-diphosphatase UppP [Clostridiales bacterium]MDY6116744.1 undecaprenyl-diphosphatase UppP [Anaerovoracaceae bacterium]